MEVVVRDSGPFFGSSHQHPQFRCGQQNESMRWVTIMDGPRGRGWRGAVDAAGIEKRVEAARLLAC